MEAWAGSSLIDPTGSSALVAAVIWIQETLLGTVATTVAIVAVASIGLMMLSGRMNVRHGATVVAGCFILFGASSIAAGIRSAGEYAYEDDALMAEHPAPPPAPVFLAPLPSKPDPDPYAGASVPNG